MFMVVVLVNMKIPSCRSNAKANLHVFLLSENFRMPCSPLSLGLQRWFRHTAVQGFIDRKELGRNLTFQLIVVYANSSSHRLANLTHCQSACNEQPNWPISSNWPITLWIDQFIVL